MLVMGNMSFYADDFNKSLKQFDQKSSMEHK